MELELFGAPLGILGISTDDQRITEESTDVESSVSPFREEDFVGIQDKEVTPASCPTNKASKVKEK